MGVELSDQEWKECLAQCDAQRLIIEGWAAAEPNLNALRCEHSRHRTLAHLRAVQETWLEAVLLFAEKDFPRIVRPHPWRLFRDRAYESIAWDEHRAAFLADRNTWRELVHRPELDRSRAGKLSGKVWTIESLTHMHVAHERHHLNVLRD